MSAGSGVRDALQTALLVGTQLSQEELEFSSRGEMLFHSLSVDVSSTANISGPLEKQVGFKKKFPIKKLKRKKKKSIPPLQFFSEIPRTKMVRSLRGLPGIHLHFKDNLFFSVMKTSSRRWLGDYSNLFRIFCKFILHFTLQARVKSQKMSNILFLPVK